MDACKKGAEERGLGWSQDVAARAAAEGASIVKAIGTASILRASILINDLKQAGVLFAQSPADSDGSIVAFLLGLSEVDPLKLGLPFEAIVSTRDGECFTSTLSVENTAIPLLVKRLSPYKIEWLSMHPNFPDSCFCKVAGLQFWIDSIGVPPPASDPSDEGLLAEM